MLQLCSLQAQCAGWNSGAAWLTWQNNIATNCPQLVKPRACRSALCYLASFSKPLRENSFNTCEKMPHAFIGLSLL